MPEIRHALHFSWNDRPVDEPMPLVKRRRVVGEQSMISHVELAKGCEVPSHRHENEQFACVLSGALEFVLGEGDAAETLVVSGGEVLHLPSNLPHAARALEDSLVLDVFSPPSEGTGLDG